MDVQNAQPDVTTVYIYHFKTIDQHQLSESYMGPNKQTKIYNIACVHLYIYVYICVCLFFC